MSASAPRRALRAGGDGKPGPDASGRRPGPLSPGKPASGGSFGGAGATVRWEPGQDGQVLTVARDAPHAEEGLAVAGRVSSPGLRKVLFSLEQPWRENAVGRSCVPEGIYRLVLTYSFRFHRDMPRLLNVPGREGILVHGGNSTADTEGCILVGMERTADGTMILRSQEALGLVIAWLRATLSRGPAWCRITGTGAKTTAPETEG